MKTQPEYYYSQSAVIPFKITNDEIEVLLVTSRKKKRWIFPKGIIEEGLSPQESAAKEALEEAGILGEVYNVSIGKYNYKKWGGKCKVLVYAMKVSTILGRWVEESMRDRKWMTIEEASELLKEKKIKKILKSLPAFVKQL